MLINNYDFPDDLYYDKNHFWVKVDDDRNVIFGATDFFQELSGEIAYIELPKKGRKVTQGELLSSLESGKWVGKIFAPVSGEIIDINSNLDSTPELMNESPFDKGWIAKIKPENLDKDLANLMKADDELENFILEQAEKFRR